MHMIQVYLKLHTVSEASKFNEELYIENVISESEYESVKAYLLKK